MSKWSFSKTDRNKKARLTPGQIIIIGFVAVILVGGLLLMLPISSVAGKSTSPSDAFFTATSATCVTGLTVLDTDTYWSGFGKGIILTMIQVGGLGFMSLAMLMSMLLKRRVSPKERVVFVQSMNLLTGERMFSFVKHMLVFTFAFESVGALLLAFKYVPLFGFWPGLAKSVFHSVSAFCNAGFDLMGGFSGEFSGLSFFAEDYYTNIVIGSLVIFGGLGFVVWQEIVEKIVSKKRLSLYSRLVLVISALLVFGGGLIFLITEGQNPHTLGGLSPGGKIIGSWFMSVTCRTAGFAALPVGKLKGVSLGLSMLLMFVGGSSGSTAGGVKTVTVGIVMIAVFQIIKGNREINIRKRRLDMNVVSRAFALIIIAGMTLLAGSFIISFTDSVFGFSDILFEAVSAFGTVGLTTGITPEISVFGRIVLMALMFFGRIGVITITYTIMKSLDSDTKSIKYPRTNVLLG